MTLKSIFVFYKHLVNLWLKVIYNYNYIGTEDKLYLNSISSHYGFRNQRLNPKTKLFLFSDTLKPKFLNSLVISIPLEVYLCYVEYYIEYYYNLTFN